jgi:hypothetical protein
VRSVAASKLFSFDRRHLQLTCQCCWSTTAERASCRSEFADARTVSPSVSPILVVPLFLRSVPSEWVEAGSATHRGLALSQSAGDDSGVAPARSVCTCIPPSNLLHFEFSVSTAFFFSAVPNEKKCGYLKLSHIISPFLGLGSLPPLFFSIPLHSQSLLK